MKEPKFPLMRLIHNSMGLDTFYGWVCSECKKEIVPAENQHLTWKFWKKPVNSECEHVGIDKYSRYYWKDEKEV